MVRLREGHQCNNKNTFCNLTANIESRYEVISVTQTDVWDGLHWLKIPFEIRTINPAKTTETRLEASFWKFTNAHHESPMLSSYQSVTVQAGLFAYLLSVLLTPCFHQIYPVNQYALPEICNSPKHSHFAVRRAFGVRNENAALTVSGCIKNTHAHTQANLLGRSCT